MGTHKIPTRSLTRIATATTAASVMAVFCYGTASAAPGDAPATQGDITTAAPSTQGPLTSDAPSTQGELTAPAAQPEKRVYWVAPPAQYDQTEWQTWDAYYDNDSTSTNNSGTATTSDNSGTTVEPAEPVAPAEPAAPLDVSTLHGPTAVEDPTAPIAAPDKTVKFGDFYADQPSWLSDQDRDRTNNSTAVIEAQVTDFWRSIGVPTDRAQRLGAAQIAAGGAGLVTGAIAAGTPGAVVGALGGGTIGGIGGALAGGLIPIAPGIAPITTGVAGTAAGAAIGAVVVGVPSAALGGAVGLATGVALGTTYGAGDLGEPQKIELPDFPQPAPAPAPAPAPVVPAPAPAPVIEQAAPVWTAPDNPVDTARGFVTTQIAGGQQALETVDAAVADATPAVQAAVADATPVVQAAVADAAPAFAAIDNALTAAGLSNPLAPAVSA
ncbi:insoluble domain protein [Rhodococcoides fascians]|uniref:insoluble domain protein n=1 Tax=Rhodococcoides fascians TaxID=1828 RepID=UPI003CEC9168